MVSLVKPNVSTTTAAQLQTGNRIHSGGRMVTVWDVRSYLASTVVTVIDARGTVNDALFMSSDAVITY